MSVNNTDNILNAEFEFIRAMENNSEIMDILVPEFEDAIINAMNWNVIIPYLMFHYRWRKSHEKNK